MDYELYGFLVVPLITGIIEIIKKTGFNVRFAPLLSLILGLAIGVGFNLHDIKFGLVLGLVLGLSSCGLYDGVKSIKHLSK